jgi:hypothetical protein
MNAKVKPDAPAAASQQTSSTTAVPAVPSTRKFNPADLKVVKVLTLPLIKLRAGMVVYVQPLKAMYEAKPIKNAKPDDKDKKPPTLLDVVNLETGELAQIILGTVLADIFNDEYPQGAYVKKGFKIEVGEQKASQAGGGKRYNQYSVFEIELPAA